MMTSLPPTEVCKSVLSLLQGRLEQNHHVVEYDRTNYFVQSSPCTEYKDKKEPPEVVRFMSFPSLPATQSANSGQLELQLCKCILRLILGYIFKSSPSHFHADQQILKDSCGSITKKAIETEHTGD